MEGMEDPKPPSVEKLLWREGILVSFIIPEGKALLATTLRKQALHQVQV